MRPIALVTTLGGFVLLGIAGCGDDRSASRDESWRDWPTSHPAPNQSAGGGGAASTGSAAGYQPSTGPIDTGTIPAVSPQPGGDVRSGDRRDYRWDTSSETTPIGSSPGISGANYGGSTVIPDTGLGYSPRNPVIVGGGGSRGSTAGTQPGAGNALTPAPRQSDTMPTGTFGMSSPERPNVGGSGSINTPIGGGTTVIVNPLEGTGFGVTQGIGTTITGSPLGGTTGGVPTTPGSGTSTGAGSGTGGVTTTPGTGTSTGGFGVNGGFTTGALGTGTGVVANPLSGSASTPEQGAITNPGAPGSNANVDPTATGATTAPGGAAPSGGPTGAASGVGAGATPSGGAASGGGAAGAGGASGGMGGGGAGGGGAGGGGAGGGGGTGGG